MKIRLCKYFLCNSKMYFISMCILTCKMFCLHRSFLSQFHHNTYTFEPFLILYKFLFFVFHFLIINIALSLCYLVVTSWLTRRFVTPRYQVSFFKMAFSHVQVGTTQLHGEKKLGINRRTFVTLKQHTFPLEYFYGCFH